MRYTLSLFVVLAFIWLVNSGHYSPLLLGMGLASVVFVILVARRMNLVDRESQPWHLSAALPAYYWWLFKKILKSNLEVAACAWRGAAAISPGYARIPTTLNSEFARVLYANSITLTPGTVSVSLDENSILVHSLTAGGLDELRGGEMENRVRVLEK